MVDINVPSRDMRSAGQPTIPPALRIKPRMAGGFKR